MAPRVLPPGTRCPGGEDVSLRDPSSSDRKNVAPLETLTLARRSYWFEHRSDHNRRQGQTQQPGDFRSDRREQLAPRHFSCDLDGLTTRLATQDIFTPTKVACLPILHAIISSGATVGSRYPRKADRPGNPRLWVVGGLDLSRDNAQPGRDHRRQRTPPLGWTHRLYAADSGERRSATCCRSSARGQERHIATSPRAKSSWPR